MSKVYLAAAKRTAIGAFNGSLSTIAPAELGAVVVKEILRLTGISPAAIDEVIVGNILPAAQGQGIGRQVAVKAGVPVEVPAYAINMACGSSMKAVMTAFANIRAGLQHLVIAGGVESMSQAPYLLPEARQGYRMGHAQVLDHMIIDALTDAFHHVHMGITAENIVAKHGITREEQDDFAWASQQKAIAAIDSGRFAEEIVPLTVKTRKETIVVDKDEYPNRTTTRVKLATLRPAFKPDGSVTAGNASGINDGAAFCLIASETAVERYQLQPLAEIVGIGQGGVDPLLMGLGPVPAVGDALSHAGLGLQQVDLIELNEAFAAQSLGVVTELCEQHQTDREWLLGRTNLNGGAIALGHPVGASGARIIVTLIHEMQKRGSRYGLASLCIGGGMGTAVILKAHSHCEE